VLEPIKFKKIFLESITIFGKIPDCNSKIDSLSGMDCNISIVGITQMLALNEAIVYENGSEALSAIPGL